MGHSKSRSKRKVCSDTSLPEETRKISDKQSKLTPKGTRKKEQIKPKLSRRKEIIKIRTEMELNFKKNKKSKESKNWFFEKINKIDKLLARLIEERENAQINKIRNERGELQPTLQKYKGP